MKLTKVWQLTGLIGLLGTILVGTLFTALFTDAMFEQNVLGGFGCALFFALVMAGLIRIACVFLIDKVIPVRYGFIVSLILLLGVMEVLGTAENAVVFRWLTLVIGVVFLSVEPRHWGSRRADEGADRITEPEERTLTVDELLAMHSGSEELTDPGMKHQ